jgi:hypothetical protein
MERIQIILPAMGDSGVIGKSVRILQVSCYRFLIFCACKWRSLSNEEILYETIPFTPNCPSAFVIPRDAPLLPGSPLLRTTIVRRSAAKMILVGVSAALQGCSIQIMEVILLLPIWKKSPLI